MEYFLYFINSKGVLILLCNFAGSSCAYNTKDVVFVLDSSGSVCNNTVVTTCTNWMSILQFVNQVIDIFANGDSETRIGIVVFGNMAQSKLFLNNGLSQVELKKFVSQLEYIPLQNTNTSGALFKVITEQFVTANGDRENIDNELIVITDGESTIDTKFLGDYISGLQNADVRTIAVGVTDNINQVELSRISSPPEIIEQALQC